MSFKVEIEYLNDGQGANNSNANAQQQTQAQHKPRGMHEQASHYDDDLSF